MRCLTNCGSPKLMVPVSCWLNENPGAQVWSFSHSAKRMSQEGTPRTKLRVEFYFCYSATSSFFWHKKRLIRS